MDTLNWLAVGFGAATTSLQVVTAGLAAVRSRPWPRSQHSPSVDRTQAVTIIRPVRGLDQYDELTLRSGFELDYPTYELIFCCEDRDDPAIGAVNRLIAVYPHVKARLLISPDKTTANPKLNNMIKGWDEARTNWVILADCNVLMPVDYVDRLLGGWKTDTGLLCSPPIGSMPEGFWAHLECAFLNGYQARWQYAADTVGLGFAQGKSMLWWKPILDEAGGIRALGAEIAEDAAATKIVRQKGLRVRLVDRPFSQPLGQRSVTQVWDRQVRWSRLRRVTFAAFFIPELLTGSLFPLLSMAFAAPCLGLSRIGGMLAVCAIWLGSEACLCAIAGWYLKLSSPIVWLLRDLLLPVLWVDAWLNNSFTWRGNTMSVSRATKA